MVDSQPEKAIQGLRQAVKADPGDVLAHTWLAIVLHDQGRTGEFVEAVREAHRQGFLGQMLRNPRFRAAFNQARLARKLPSELAN
jgi:hypothetical protein